MFWLVNCQILIKICQLSKKNQNCQILKYLLRFVKCQNLNFDLSIVKNLKRSLKCQKKNSELSHFKIQLVNFRSRAVITSSKCKIKSNPSTVKNFTQTFQMSKTLLRPFKCQQWHPDLSNVKFELRSLKCDKNNSNLSTIKNWPQICQLCQKLSNDRIWSQTCQMYRK